MRGSFRTHSSALGLPATLALACAAVFLGITCWAFWTAATHPVHVDFLSFWAAGRLALQGHPAAVYDIVAHRRLEAALAPGIGILPFPYPPPFIAVVTPFALLPFAAAFVVWVLATGIFYFSAGRRLVPASYLLANPPALADAMIGQTGLLAAGLFMTGISILAQSPFAAGAILGLMIFKPQLALMLPVALLAGGHWRAIGGALFSSSLMVAAGLALFGARSYAGFFHILPQYADYLRHARWDWAELASPFAFARYFQVPAVAALAMHILIAVAAAATTWLAWASDWKEKVPVLASATLLASPYLFTYDAVLLVLPAAWFAKQRRFWLAGLLWLLAALPVAHFFGLYDGPNTIPLASIAVLLTAGVSRIGGVPFWSAQAAGRLTS
jgi:hypothetical protein